MKNQMGEARPGAVLAQTNTASGQPGRVARRLGLASVLCASFGCASATPAVRDVASASPSAPRESTSAEHAEPRRSADAHAAAPVSTARHAADSRQPELAWLSPSHVGAAVRAHHEDFQACQALGDLESRREDGAVTVGWLVLPDGSVNDVTVGPSTFRSASINACVLGVAKQVTFPRSGAPTNISWTLEFRGASSHAPLATVH